MSTANVPAAGNSDVVSRRIATLEEPRATWSLSERNELPKLLLGDVVIGTCVSFGISPFVAMIDQAIVQRSMGSHTITSSIRASMAQMIRQPATYFRSTPFLWMWALYAATYSTANTLKTLQEREFQSEKVTENADRGSTVMCTSSVSVYSTIRFEDAGDERAASLSIDRKSRSGSFFADRAMSWMSGTASYLLASPLCLLVGTGAVNISMSLMKDRAYAHLFASQEPNIANRKPPMVPKVTYALWTVRDLMVVGSSFLLPDMAVQHCLKHGYIDHTQTSSTLRSAQFLIPVASQVFAGPLHLLGLNIYEHPKATPLERLRCFQNGALTSVITARMSRILQAFSVGGVGNTYFREIWRRWVKAT